MDYLALTLPGGQSVNPPSGIPKGGISTVSEVFKNGLTIMIILCIVVSLVFIILAAISWIRSGGDKNKLQAARAKLTYAIIGLIVAFMAFFIVSIIGYVFKIDLLNVGR